MLGLATLLLMPGQGSNNAGIEILVVGGGTALVLVYLHVRAPRKALGVTRVNFATRVAFDQLGPVLLIIGSVSLLAGNGGGLYWVVPALVAAMIAAIVGAWVMLVEILR